MSLICKKSLLENNTAETRKPEEELERKSRDVLQEVNMSTTSQDDFKEHEDRWLDWTPGTKPETGDKINLWSD